MAQTAKDLLTAKIDDVVQRVRSNPAEHYLGSPDVGDNLQWYRDGRTHRLVAKEDATRADQEKDEFSAGERADEPDPPSSAVLSAFVIISDRGTFVKSDCGWTPYGQFSSPDSFPKIQYNITAEQPANLVHATLHEDFATVLSNLRKLLKKGEIENNKIHEGIIMKKDSQEQVRFRHRVFDTIENQTEQDTKDIENFPETCSIRAFPTTTDAAASQLDKLRDDGKYYIRPFRAFDTNNDVLQPSQYDEIKGALCLVHFTLTRFSITVAAANKAKGIAAEEKDRFTADIVRLAMLTVGSGRTSGKKRTYSGDLDQFTYASPSKKKKTD